VADKDGAQAGARLDAPRDMNAIVGHLATACDGYLGRARRPIRHDEQLASRAALPNRHLAGLFAATSRELLDQVRLPVASQLGPPVDLETEVREVVQCIAKNDTDCRKCTHRVDAVWNRRLASVKLPRSPDLNSVAYASCSCERVVMRASDLLSHARAASSPASTPCIQYTSRKPFSVGLATSKDRLAELMIKPSDPSREQRFADRHRADTQHLCESPPA